MVLNPFYYSFPIGGIVIVPEIATGVSSGATYTLVLLYQFSDLWSLTAWKCLSKSIITII